MAKTKITFVRHGFTPANNAGWNNQEGIRDVFYRDELCPLDKEYGVKQAEELGEFLGEYLKGKKVLFLVGPYYRTKQTAMYATKYLDPSLVTLEISEPLREINQGLNYAQPKSHFEGNIDAEVYYDESKTDHAVAVPYLSGESEMEVRRRVRPFVRKLEKIRDSEEYDEIVILSSMTTIKWVYYWLYGKPLDKKPYTASVITAEENAERIFVPETAVPKGYMVDFEPYKNYNLLMDFYELMEPLRGTAEFQKFYGKLTLPMEDNTMFIEKRGETLIIPAGNTEKKGYFFIDSTYGQEAYTYDKKSTSTYFILDGEGVFELDGKRFAVKAGDVVTVPKNTVFYYSGKMKMIERMIPNFNEKNIVVVKELTTEEIKRGISLNGDEVKVKK